MTLHWLQMNRACILEVPQLKDYGGQPLIFKGAMQKRCVTEDVFKHPVIQTYLAQLLLIEVGVAGGVPVPAAPTVDITETVKSEEVVTVIKTPVIEEPPAPESVAVPVQELVAEPVMETVPESTPAPEPASMSTEDASSVSVEDTSSKDTDDGKGFEVKRRRR